MVLLDLHLTLWFEGCDFSGVINCYRVLLTREALVFGSMI